MLRYIFAVISAFSIYVLNVYAAAYSCITLGITK